MMVLPGETLWSPAPQPIDDDDDDDDGRHLKNTNFMNTTSLRMQYLKNYMYARDSQNIKSMVGPL